MATREIEFRVWDNDSEEMVIGGVGIDVNGIAYVDNPLTGDFTYYPGDPIMQYTDLRDKNGAKIYEGDIIKFQLIARPAETYVVEWGHFGFTYKKSGDEGDHYLQQAYLEVIGNIYENKDLL